MTDKELLAELKKSYEYLYDIRENGCFDHCTGQMEQNIDLLDNTINNIEKIYEDFYKTLDLEDLISIIKKKHLNVEKVYELDNIDDQIKFELLKIIEKNYVINKCENCGKLFIPVTSSKNKEQKGRTDQKYCDNIYLDTGKTCKEIGALNKRKEKVENSPILSEYKREYSRMHGLHYNHQKQFTEKKFKDWSKKAKKLTTKFTDEQAEEFKIELKNLSQKYWI